MGTTLPVKGIQLGRYIQDPTLSAKYIYEDMLINVNDLWNSKTDSEIVYQTIFFNAS